mmetsp:Transcript_53660/g.154717  ORF Transcript_53660/g.154717 Transcript_53660/m.154717 type:complete len:212 (+) Transcript_53660:359-994(+)
MSSTRLTPAVAAHPTLMMRQEPLPRRGCSQQAARRPQAPRQPRASTTQGRRRSHPLAPLCPLRRKHPASCPRVRAGRRPSGQAPSRHGARRARPPHSNPPTLWKPLAQRSPTACHATCRRRPHRHPAPMDLQAAAMHFEAGRVERQQKRRQPRGLHRACLMRAAGAGHHLSLHGGRRAAPLAMGRRRCPSRLTTASAAQASAPLVPPGALG